MSRRVAIVGGGMAGLAAANEIEKARRFGAAVTYSLLEASDRLGGMVRTERVGGCVVEGGPDSFLTSKPWARQLAVELGLEGQLIASKDADRKTYILRGGKLVPLPDGLQLFVPSRPVAAFLSPLFSWRTKLAMVREMVSPPQAIAADEDESVANFVERHFGREMVETVAAPLLAGVFGGDAERLSARSVMPKLLESEVEHRSLVRAAVSAKGSTAIGPVFTSLKQGMQQLTDAVTAELRPGDINLRTPLLALRNEATGWRVILADGRHEMFTDIILATPTYISSALLKPVAPVMAEALNGFTHSSSTVVVFAFEARYIPALPTGFGFLVPRGENKRMLACTFVDQKFTDRAPQGMKVLRVFAARGDESDDLLVATLRKELEGLLRILAEPEFVRVFHWPRSMLQHEVGHLGRVRRLEEAMSQLPGIQIAGAGLFGAGLPDAVRSGRDAAARVLAGMPQKAATPGAV